MNLQKYREKVGFVKFYAVMIIALVIIFYAGYEFAHVRKEALQADNRLLQKSISNLSQEHDRLVSEFNMLKVELDIAELANEQSQIANSESLSREQALKEQISFYQRVMAPELSQDGFVVERMEIAPTLSDNNYAIKLMMLQHENIKAVVKGELDIRIFGSEDGKPTSFSLASVQDEPKSSMEFAFKYFQVIETSVTLPENFTPDRFEISTDIYKYKRKRGDYETSIKWEEAFSE